LGESGQGIGAARSPRPPHHDVVAKQRRVEGPNVNRVEVSPVDGDGEGGLVVLDGNVVRANRLVEVDDQLGDGLRGVVDGPVGQVDGDTLVGVGLQAHPEGPGGHPEV